MKSPLDDPHSREFYESAIPYSPESTDGRSAWWDLLELLAVWGIAVVLATAFVGWMMWWFKIGVFG